MDPKLLFWFFAFTVMALAVGIALLGRRRARAGRLDSHRRAMHTSALLIGIFLVAYVVKVVVLGREDLSVWSPAEIALLRFHETFVSVMLLSGVGARFAARGLRRAGVAGGDGRATTVHRSLGRTAFVSALLGLATGGMIFAVMIAH